MSGKQHGDSRKITNFERGKVDRQKTTRIKQAENNMHETGGKQHALN